MALLGLPNEVIFHIAGSIVDKIDLIDFALAHPSLNWLLETTPYHEAVFDYGWTLLHWAAAYNRVAVAKEGLSRGQDINAVNSEGQTALWLAADKGAVDVASLLLALEGVDVDVEARCDWNMWNALFQACWQKRDKVIELFISSGRFDPNAKCSTGWTPLHKSVKDNRKESVQALLKSGKVDVNKRGLSGESPWEAACLHGLNEIGNMLIDAGLDVMDVNPESGETVLHVAAHFRMLGCMLRILDMGVLDVNAVDNSRSNLLHSASAMLMNQRERAEVVKALLDRGCNPTARNLHGLTPLDFCMLRRHFDAARILGWDGGLWQQTETGERVPHRSLFTVPHEMRGDELGWRREAERARFMYR